MAKAAPLIFGQEVQFVPFNNDNPETALEPKSFGIILENIDPENASFFTKEIKKVIEMGNKEGCFQSSVRCVPKELLKEKQSKEAQRAKKRKSNREYNKKPDVQKKRKAARETPAAKEKQKASRSNPINKIKNRFKDQERRRVGSLLKEDNEALYQHYRQKARELLEPNLAKALETEPLKTDASTEEMSVE